MGAATGIEGPRIVIAGGGLAGLSHGHDAYLTIGENIGQPGCTIPTCGLEWITTRQPVVLVLTWSRITSTIF